jgi:asparagine synthase (glutamine-hydrolysing)
VVARDRLGVKPVYYAQSGNLVVFGSELKSVLASGLVPTELDLDAIDAYLTLGFVPGPRTPLAAVRKLMPGERLVVEAGRVRLERYWVFPAPRPEPLGRHGVDELASQLLDVLDESVRIRLMSDVPLGAMLSGGLDSSLIVALMARHLTKPVKTFSVGFVESGRANELADARAVAEVFGTEHHELELSFVDQTVSLPELSWHLDEPLADLSALGFFALSKLAAETVTVALAGQGADELFGGYSRHRNAALATRLRRLPAPLRRALTVVGGHAPGRFRRVGAVLRAPDPVSRHVVANRNLDDVLRAGLVRGALAERHGLAARTVVADRLGGATGDPLALMLYLDGQLGLVDDMLHYFDRTSMACSLEVRVPFLDHEMVEFSARVPTELKVRGLTTKYLLKQAARGVIPDGIIDKPKVGFFNAAVSAWFTSQTTGSIAEYLLAPDAAYAELLDPAEVRRLVLRHRAGEAPGAEHALLSILMLEVWLSEFLPRAVASATPARPRAVVTQ